MAGEIRDKVTSSRTTQPGYEKDVPATDSSEGKDDEFGVSSTAERNADRKHVGDDKTSVLGNTSNVLTAKEDAAETDGTKAEEPSGTAAASLELSNSMEYNDGSVTY
jgi:hypothetical protein